MDLVGHMSGHRLLTFARKPAPIQVTAWGEPTGTGLKTMDYLLSDPVLVPVAERELLAEKVVDLPNFLGFLAGSEPLPEPSPLPALSRGYVTFGSFNRLDKCRIRCCDLNQDPQSDSHSHLILRTAGWVSPCNAIACLRSLQGTEWRRNA